MTSTATTSTATATSSTALPVSRRRQLGRRMFGSTATSIPGTESLYVSANARRTDSGSSEPFFSRVYAGPVFSRLFGMFWLAFLVSAYVDLWREDQSVLRAIPSWTALIVFTLSFTVLQLFGTPLWATNDLRDQAFNRAMIAVETISLLLLVVLLPAWHFGFVFIYIAVSAGIYLTRREGIRVVLFITALAVLTTIAEHGTAGDVGTVVVLVGGIGMSGIFWCSQMAQNRELRQARAEITRLAVTEERLRIARDLHDLLGHTLSTIALKSELAGRLISMDPERATIEITDVQLVSRTALQEVREAVAGYRRLTLNDEVAQGTQLLRAAGVQLSATLATPALPMDIDRALAWFVREGTTNIIRHAKATRATLRIEHLGDRVFAEYTDNGSGGSKPAHGAGEVGPLDNGSFGLIGLGERMRALGGEFSCGPMPDQGFRLYVTLPLIEASAPTMESVR